MMFFPIHAPKVMMSSTGALRSISLVVKASINVFLFLSFIRRSILMAC